MHPSHLKRKGSLCLFGFCLLVSSVPNFCPDTGRRRWSLVQVASSIALRGGRSAAFPIYAAQAPGCSMWNLPCAARSSSPRVLHKSADSAPPVFCAFPARAAQAARSLTGALSPGAGRLLPSTSPAPIPAPAGQVPAPSRVSGGLGLETGGLCAVRWELWSLWPSLPLSPPPCLQSPARLGHP